jgi:hypothetical protein
MEASADCRCFTFTVFRSPGLRHPRHAIFGEHPLPQPDVARPFLYSSATA